MPSADLMPKPSLKVQWAVSVGSVVVCGALLTGLVHHTRVAPEIIHALLLAAMGCVAYAWMVLPFGGRVAIATVVLICLPWAGLLWHANGLWWDSAAYVLILSAAIWQQQRCARRCQQMQQVLDDLREAAGVNEQEIAKAGHAHEALQRKLSRYGQLQSIAETLSSMTDLPSIAQFVVDQAFELIGKSDVCLLLLVNQEQQELSLFASKKRGAIASIHAKHGDQFDRHVLRSHRPLLVSDVRRDFRFTPHHGNPTLQGGAEGASIRQGSSVSSARSDVPGRAPAQPSQELGQAQALARGTGFTAAMASERTIGSVIAAPLLIGQSPEGVLRLDSAQLGAYTQDDLRFLDVLLGLVSAAITNAKLFAQTQQLALTDGLTGLMLRRPFVEQLTRELTRSVRTHEPLAALMLDVDDFKAYNDTFGHLAGDRVLKMLAELLRSAVPPGSAVARYGGEEFAILLGRMSRTQAHEVAERIRRLVEEQGQESGTSASRIGVASGAGAAARPSQGLKNRRSTSAQRPITISIGVAAFPEDAQVDLELVRIADQRLYQAKRDGRNRVCSSSENT